MCEKFLEGVARYFADKSLNDFTFIFPNRRSSVFFKKYLGESRNGVLFSPKILTVSELFSFAKDASVAHYLTLLVTLWEEWNKLLREDKREELDDFLYWGDLILSDFSDVDYYLVNHKDLFKNLKDFQNIESDFSWMNLEQKEAAERITGIKEFWKKISTNRSKLSKNSEGANAKDLGGAKSGEGHQEIFLSKWDLLLPLYDNFKKVLKEKGIYYNAMLYREVAEEIIESKKFNSTSSDNEVLTKLSSLGNVAFVGFSAPTNCEKEVMRYFKREGKALFFWDYFSDWIKDPQNKSSLLISSCIKEFGNDYPLIDENSGNASDSKNADNKEVNSSLNVIAYPVVGSVQQSSLASSILSSQIIKDDKEGINTAVIVSDDTLLIPLLQSLPTEYENVNVTMGYSISASPLYSLITSLLRVIATRSLQGDKTYYHTNNLLALLKSPYLIDLKVSDYKIDQQIIDLVVEPKDISYYISNIENQNNYYISIDSNVVPYWLIQDEATQFSINSLIDFFKGVLKRVENGIYRRVEGSVSYERDMLYLIYETLDEIKSLNLNIKRVRSAISIIKSAINQISLNFKGEPLKGVQIMGPLETRLLDFDNIIFLSFNEGMFPKSGEQKSAIPYFLRKSFALPTYEYKDSISAYNFYRLIQRAKNIYCIYDTNNNSDSGGLKEESRFLKQLEYAYDVNVKRYNIESEYISETIEKVDEYPVDERAIEKIKNKRYSASLLNSYLACPLLFYLNGLLNAYGKEQEIEEGIDNSGFGTLFHYCMKVIYSDFECKEGKNRILVSQNELKKVLSQYFGKNERNDKKDKIDQLLLNGFKEELNIHRVEGENYILKELVKGYIEKTIRKDLERIKDEGEFEYVQGEKEIKDLTIEIDGAQYNLYGIIDRVEKSNSGYLLSDYKTGKYKKIPEKNIEDFEQLLDKIFDNSGNRDPIYGYLFQLLFYALIFNKWRVNRGEIKEYEDITISLYQVQQIEDNGFFKYNVTSEKLKEFEERLKQMLKEIVSIAIGEKWKRNKDSNVCQYCDFNSFCQVTIKKD